MSQQYVSQSDTTNTQWHRANLRAGEAMRTLDQLIKRALKLSNGIDHLPPSSSKST